ncbi:MAG: hypothetical protein KGL39_32605 [Patescibacteria group bacterium]|nr:hypothetical protein [Patescibacteria group bacterium]
MFSAGPTLSGNNAARPLVRAQLHPRALEIIDVFERIPEGYTPEGVPMWRGVSDATWVKIAADHAALIELREIMRTHYPTACAVLLKVKSKRTGGLVPFIFNRAQCLVWNRIVARLIAHKPLFFIILKARQLGISTFVLAWQWWNLWRLQDSEVLMVGHQVKLVESFIDTMRRFHEELPNIPGLKPKLRSHNADGGRVPKHEIYYADRRTKGVTVISKNLQTRGLSAPNQHFSEFAFFEDPGGILRTLLPMLPPVGSIARLRASIFIETTPNGKNDFYNFYELGKTEESDWESIFIAWMVAEDEYSYEPPKGWKITRDGEARRKALSHERKKIDGYEVTRAQMYWREREMANQGWNEDFFDQEYPSDDESCFLLQSHSVFKDSMRYLQKCVRDAERGVAEEFAKRRIAVPAGTTVVRGELKFEAGPGPFDKWIPKKLEPRFEQEKSGRLCVWSPPQVGHAYAIGIDTAAGLNQDASVGWVLDVTEGRQVAEWYSRSTDEDPFTDEMVALGYWYNTATLYPEINSIGRAVMKRMRRVWRYPRIGLEEKWDEAKLKDGKYGLMMTDALKEELVRKLKWFISQRYLAIASGGTLSELSTFEKDGEHYGASSGSHDDRVIAAGLACMVVQQTPRLYMNMTRKRHESVPTAYDLGLARLEAPPESPPATLTGEDPFRDMPPEIRKIMENSRKQMSALPTHPIRG